MPYRAPVDQINFVLNSIVDLPKLAETEVFADATSETVSEILNQAGKMATEVVAPTNRAGDEHPARLENGVVRSSPGFSDAFKAIAEGGWIGLAASPEYGGMGLPQAVNMAVNEMLAGANLALQLNPLLTQGQIEALEHHGADWMKELYLPKLTSGEWSGTMNLTEPGAGSDVGKVATKAEPDGDGTYRINGQKIYITWGDSDMSSNVSHLVLARLPDAPKGTKGISLFLVPKFLPNDAGEPTTPNNVSVVSLEHKLGIHGSPTCVLSYADSKGWLVDAPGKGMAAMFTMMNNARLAVGVQGVGVAEAALQKAAEYAAERDQMGRIITHPDVRRMLATGRAEVFAARSICLACAMALDMARATGDAAWKARAALLTPIAKAHGTDVGCQIADMGVQVHGGMGYVEETGAAQYLRDVRITPIYEGTNGIQAMDLVGRKMMDGGDAAGRLLDEAAAHATSVEATLPELAAPVRDAIDALRAALQELTTQEPLNRFSSAVPFLNAFARVLGAHYHLKAAEVGNDNHRALATIYITRVLPHHAADLAIARAELSDLMAIDDSVFAEGA